MPSFLQLVQNLGSESGTVTNNGPTTVVGQSGRLAKLVHWTRAAYRQIENAHAEWGWLQGEFSGSTEAGTSAYISQLARFAEYIHRGDTSENRYSLFDPDVGRASEAQLRWVDYDTYYTTYTRGANAERQGKPSLFSFAPDGSLNLFPTPDKTYTIRGPYRKGAQSLDLDTDVPEMPARFHDIIVDAALVLLATHDEAAPTLTLYQLRQLRGFNALERDQLPRITLPGPLA